MSRLPMLLPLLVTPGVCVCVCVCVYVNTYVYVCVCVCVCIHITGLEARSGPQQREGVGGERERERGGLRGGKRKKDRGREERD